MRTALLAAIALAVPLVAQEPQTLHGKRPATLAIEGAMVVKGDGTPPYGPTTLFVRDGVIVSEKIERPEATIDASGSWVMPGLVSTHAHLEERKADQALPPEYQLSLWVASGITTIRDVGSTFPRSMGLRARSEKGEIAAPRIFLYRGFGPVETADEAQKRVQSFKSSGADGIKLWSNASYDEDLLKAILQAAQGVGLRTTAHIGVGPTNALHYAYGGVTSIEHWYGIPDAALRGGGVQEFPPDFSYSNEVHRFREAGKLWAQTDPEKLDWVLRTLVDSGVAWSPTLAVYEASRDLVRAQGKPWFQDYLHPAIERFFTPDLGTHGSYFLGWTTADEVAWKENYRLWMQALRRFAELGGTITTGEDAAYIYLLYGFGLVRELELHQEAGFHPLEVIRHATYNGAKVLGQEDRFGRVRPGLAADLIVVPANPLANLKVLYPTGADENRDGKSVRTGGVRWTIKDGRVWHGPTLLQEVRQIVRDARDKQAKAGGMK